MKIIRDGDLLWELTDRTFVKFLEYIAANGERLHEFLDLNGRQLARADFDITARGDRIVLAAKNRLSKLPPT